VVVRGVVQQQVLHLVVVILRRLMLVGRQNQRGVSAVADAALVSAAVVDVLMLLSMQGFDDERTWLFGFCCSL
jgi:hypothetical protein